MSKLTDKLAKLQDLVDWFEGSDMDIDQAIGKYDEVKKLSADIEKDLADLETKLTVVQVDAGSE